MITVGLVAGGAAALSVGCSATDVSTAPAYLPGDAASTSVPTDVWCKELRDFLFAVRAADESLLGPAPEPAKLGTAELVAQAISRDAPALASDITAVTDDLRTQFASQATPSSHSRTSSRTSDARANLARELERECPPMATLPPKRKVSPP